MGYLDNAGLERLWSKIRSALSRKQDAASAFTQSQADGRYLKLSGGSMTGALSVQAPTQGSHVATKQYVDGLLTSKGEDGVPSGVIVLWSGASGAIPEGWALCNGTNGTPDLRDRFVLGAGGRYSVGARGGEETHKLTLSETPAAIPDIPDGNLVQCIAGSRLSASESYRANKVGFVQDNQDVEYSMTPLSNVLNELEYNTAHNNMPPYYALCYIMKR